MLRQMEPHMHRFLAPLAPLAASLVLAGCAYTPGGPLKSNDQFTYESTVYQPVNVALVDTRTSETIWSMEVPVGRKVTVRFYHDKTEGYEDYPDLMKWEVQGDEDFNGILRSKITVPDRWSRRIDVTYRDAPEFYPGAEPMTSAD
jgi:hypothetical protein